MLFPEFLKENDLIGITAPSAGVKGRIESFEKSIQSLRKEGFQILETANVRSDNIVSSSANQRAEQLNELVVNNQVKMIMCASGGDFLIEILPYLKLDNILANPKWILGYSDPTNLLYLITTKLDIATLYGTNAGSYDQEDLHESLKNNIEILKGNLVEQRSFKLYEKEKLDRLGKYNLTEKVYWENLNGDFCKEGRVIGGCLDCLRNIIGTQYDHTLSFVEKYKKDGFLWYLDIWGMSSEEVFCTLFQMKEIGWFQYAKGIVFGRTMFPREFGMTYQECIKRVFTDIPIVFNADIGHVSPRMTMINGAIAKIEVKNGKGRINFRLM